MGGIKVEFQKLEIDDKNHVKLDNKEIGKWWGKTLYHYKEGTNELEYKNFNLFELVAHYCLGYERSYTSDGLKKWLISKVPKTQDSKADYAETTEKTIFQAIKNLLPQKETKEKLIKQFEDFCQNTNKTDEEIIALFGQDKLDANELVDSERNISVLLEACRWGRLEVVKYLLNNKADKDVITKEKSAYLAKTPLQMAIQIQHLDLVNILLEAGADVKTENSKSQSVLLMAIDNLGNPGAWYVGKTAKEPPTKEIIAAILKKGVDVNAGYSETPLHCACRKGDLEVAKMLIEKNADVDGFGTFGKPPLLAAIESGNENLVKYLLDNKAFPNPKRPSEISKDYGINRHDEWKTPIMVAVENRKPTLVSILVAAGSNINDTGGRNNETPLHIAISKNDYQMVDLLLKNKADTQIENDRGITPWDIATGKGWVKVDQHIIELIKGEPQKPELKVDQQPPKADVEANNNQPKAQQPENKA